MCRWIEKESLEVVMSNAYANIWQNIALPIQNGSAQIIAAIMAYLGPVFQARVLAYMLITLLIQAYSRTSGPPRTYLSKSP